MPPSTTVTDRQGVGIALVVISAMAIAIVPTAARLAYDGGSNTLTVVTLRGLIAIALIGAYLGFSGGSFRASPSAIRWSILSGLFYAAMAYGYLGSVAYIPVSLAILIFFIHPILIALIAHLLGKEHLGPKKLMLALMVFVGLAAVVGPDMSTLDPMGIALALLAAVTVCGMILCNAEAQREASSTLVNLYMTTVTAVIFVAVTSLLGTWVFPSTSLGWAGIIGAGLGLALGLLGFFAAFRFIGAVRATMISNLEPLLGILLAMAILGERLEGWQWAGALVVFAGLILFEMPERNRKVTKTA
jgi:drug/metabolite transporter (DMT)-like permease